MRVAGFQIQLSGLEMRGSEFQMRHPRSKYGAAGSKRIAAAGVIYFHQNVQRSKGSMNDRRERSLAVVVWVVVVVGAVVGAVDFAPL